MHGVVSEDWKRAMIVPLSKSKDDRHKCKKNHRGTSLLSVVGKVYGKIVIHAMEYMLNNEHGGFWSGRESVYKVLAIRQLVEKVCKKDCKLYCT